MREVKLVVWDLDDTLVDGVFDEGDRELKPLAEPLLDAIDGHGILQALATQNETETASRATAHFGWDRYFQLARSGYAPKADKVRAILDELEIAAGHAAFVDGDAFERAAIEAQVPGIRSFSLGELQELVSGLTEEVTDEARRRPEMYRALRAQQADESQAADYEAFLASCDIRVTVRPFRLTDHDRLSELLRRTNRMNLGSAEPPEKLLERTALPDGPRLVIASLQDRYGDSGRCGVIAVGDHPDGARLESIAISCRARARGLSLAILVAMLRHPSVTGRDFLCRFQDTGRNRPLRMLLWASGFTAVDGTDELLLKRERLEGLALPDWATIEIVEESTNKRAAGGPATG